MGELQKGEKHFLLFGHSSQKIDGDVQCLFVAVFGGQPHAGLRLRAVACLCFQSGGQGSVHHFAHGAHIVRGDPLPQPVLVGQDDRCRIEHTEHFFDLAVVEVGLVVVDAYAESRHRLALTPRHEQAHAGHDAVGFLVVNGITECALQGQRQYHVYVSHENIYVSKGSKLINRYQICHT